MIFDDRHKGSAGKRGINRQEHGFTLIEVIMAITVLSIGLLAVASMQISAMWGNAIAKDYTESTDRVQDAVEKIYSLSFTDEMLSDADGDGVDGLDDTGGGADWSITDNPRYTIYWNVAANWAGGNSMTGVNTIRVIVVWQERGSQKRYSFDLMRTRI